MNQAQFFAVPIDAAPGTIIPGRPEELFSHTSKGIRSGDFETTAPYDISPDGDFVAVNLGGVMVATDADAVEARPRINVVLNWTEELKRLVPTD